MSVPKETGQRSRKMPFLSPSKIYRSFFPRIDRIGRFPLAFTLVFLLPAFLVWGCSKSENTASAAKEASNNPSSTQSITVDVAPVKGHSLERKVEFVGSLMADEEVTVSSEMDNIIERIAVDLGDRVKKGDLLVRLADEELKLKAEEAHFYLKEVMAKLGIDEKIREVSDPAQTTVGKKARADLDDAELSLKRVQSLVEQKIASRQGLDNAETRFKIARENYQAALESVKTLMATLEAKKAWLALAKKKLADTLIKAPIDGAVSERFVSSGEYVKVGNPLVTLVRDNPLKLRGFVPERYAAEIQVGQEVAFVVDAYPAAVFKGKIARISPSSNVDTRSIGLEASIPNDKLLLKPGFFAKATVSTRIDEGVPVIPNAALYTFAGVNKVFVIEEGRVHQRFVKLGVRDGEFVEVVEGVKVGEMVAVSGLNRLEDDTPVIPKGE